MCSRLLSRALFRVLPYPSCQDAGPGSGRSALSALQSRSGVGRQDSASQLSELESTATRESGARRAGRAMDHGTKCLNHPPALINHRVPSAPANVVKQVRGGTQAARGQDAPEEKRSRRPAEARSRIFDGQRSPIAGGSPGEPGSKGPRRVWFGNHWQLGPEVGFLPVAECPPSTPRARQLLPG